MELVVLFSVCTYELHRCYQTQLKAHEKVMLITTFNSFSKICHGNEWKQSSDFFFCNGFNQEHLLWSQNYTTVKPPEECECVLCSQILVIRGSKQSAQCWCDRNLYGWYPWIIPWVVTLLGSVTTAWLCKACQNPVWGGESETCGYIRQVVHNPVDLICLSNDWKHCHILGGLVCTAKKQNHLSY